MKKILVTGGAGFVGRHFVAQLLKQGHEVHCVDSLVPGTGGIHPDAGWPLFDPRSYDTFHFYAEDCRSYFQRVNDDDFDYCFHLAAIVGGRLVIEHNPLAVADDLAIDSAYWQWALRTHPKKTIAFSSSAVYPIHLQTRDHHVLLAEDMTGFDERLGMPDLSYGWSKLTCEYLAKLAHERHGLDSVCYRPFSGYGPDQDHHYPFPSICKRVLDHHRDGKHTIEVWGSGQQMRDFIHIDDCVTGVLMTMDQIDDGRALNLSTGRATPFAEFLRIAAGVLGFEPTLKPLLDKPEGVFARVGDTRLQAEYGFHATTRLEDGIREAIERFATAPNAPVDRPPVARGARVPARQRTAS